MSDPLRRLLAVLASPAADDAERIDRIRLMEEAKAAIGAMQLRETAEFVRSQRVAQRRAGVPAHRQGRGIAHQVALAKRISPYRGHQFVQAAMILPTELPRTFAELSAGRTSEWRATIVARETAWLSEHDRATVDRLLAPRLSRLGDRAVESETKSMAYRLDPAGYVERIKGADKDRRVTVRPAPDVMGRLSALLPAARAIAAYTSLAREADQRIAVGDGRTRGQIMADTLVERLTGQTRAADVPVEIGLIMTDRTLVDGDGEPAILDGYGPVPAAIARELITEPSDATSIALRQLLCGPTGQLVSMSARRRPFGGVLRRFVRYRDQYCRTPFCGAPIRHIDHVEDAGHGGATTAENGQGYCAACNYAKQAPGWHAQPVAGSANHVVEVRTPTGHRYRSVPPDPPGDPPRAA